MRIAALCCLALVLSSRPAAAEWHFAALAGLTMFGDTSVVDIDAGTSRRHLNGGASVAWLSRGLFGVEATGTWTPKFFQGERRSLSPTPAAATTSTQGTVSLMGNVMVTLPQRWTEYSLRPFVSAGFGLLHANKPDALLPVKLDALGFNLGGGAVGFLSPRTGLRFDVRYHTTLNRSEDAPSFGAVHLRYVTAQIGLVFRR